MKPRKIPLRRCTGCREMKSKKEMIRIVKGPEGDFSVDLTSKKSGRGAYVCPDAGCLEKAYKSKGLEKSFGAAVPGEVYESLRAEIITNG